MVEQSVGVETPEGTMPVELVAPVLGFVALTLVMIALAWAALERGRIHSRTRLCYRSRLHALVRRSRVELLSALNRLARRAGRIPLAVSTVAVWV